MLYTTFILFYENNNGVPTFYAAYLLNYITCLNSK